VRVTGWVYLVLCMGVTVVTGHVLSCAPWLPSSTCGLHFARGISGIPTVRFCAAVVVVGLSEGMRGGGEIPWCGCGSNNGRAEGDLCPGKEGRL
jgi:hypothetical protein